MRPLALVFVCALLPALPASGDGPDGPRRPFAAAEGKWRVVFANGVTQESVIRPDGGAAVAEPLRQSAGQAEIRGGSFVISFADDRVERWTPVGGRFVVEHWFPASQVPVATPVLGIAERAP